MVLAAAAEDAAVGRDDPHDFVDVLAVDELTRETDPAQPFVGDRDVDVELPFEAPGDRRQGFGPEVEPVLLPREHLLDVHPAQRQQPGGPLEESLLAGTQPHAPRLGTAVHQQAARRQRDLVILVLGIGVHVESRSEHRRDDLSRDDDEGPAGVVLDLEIGLAVDLHAAFVAEQRGIDDARAAVEPHPRTVGRHHIVLLPACIHHNKH